MSDNEKLQKAVELSISAGYQLNKDAFELLSLLATTEDPAEIISQAIQKIEALPEKPLFIDRGFLETLIEKPLETKKANSEFSEPDTALLHETQITKTKLFHPYAKEVESSLKILEDPGSKLSSNGAIEDYLTYFQDRFKRMEKLLRQRIDARTATTIIEAFKAPANTSLKIIGMVTEKRESNQRILMNIEDLQASTTVLVPQNAPETLQRKAKNLLLDQVICLSVRKTRTNLLIAEDIFLPDVAQKTQNKAPVPVYAVLTSDIHVGSTKFQREAFNRFILWLNGKYGNEKMKEMAGHVKYVLIAGDIVDGIGVYPNQVKELAVKDVYAQYRLAAKYIEQIPDYIEVIVIPGNHDAPRKALPQPPISDEFLESLQESRKIHSLGNPCYLNLHSVEVLMYHGRSLDDITSTVPSMDYQHPEKAMVLLLQCRHLAPAYGAKTPVSPESRDSLIIEKVPDIFHVGHVHVLNYVNYRGVLAVNSGGWQDQTDYMRRLGVIPTISKVPLVNLQTFETSIIPFG